MTIPQFLVTSEPVAALSGDTADTGDDLNWTALSGLTFQFVPNLPLNTFVPVEGAPGGLYLVRPVDAIVHTDGVLHRVSGGVMGAAGVPLLADGAVAELDGPLQWKVKPGSVAVDGTTVKPKAWWFDARAAGVAIPLSQLPPVIGAAATGTTRGPKGDDGEEGPPGTATWDTLDGKPAVVAAGPTKAAARTAIDALDVTAVAAQISTAFTNFIAGAPGALDTWLELTAAVQADETALGALTTLVGQKVDKKTDVNTVYGVSSTGVQEQKYVDSGSAGPWTLAQRDANGRLRVADATVAGQAASKGQLDTGLSGKLSTPGGTPTGAKFLRDDNTWQTPPAGGGGSGAAAFFRVGDGAATSFTLNHGMGTRAVNVIVRRRSNRQRVYVDDYVLTPNAVKVEPSAGVVWALNEMEVTVTGTPGLDDVTAPTAPTITSPAKTVSTIDASASGSTDAVGVVAYNWYLNGVYVTSTAGPTYQYTGLNGATAYTIGATTFDAAGNESALGTTSVTTDAPSNVGYASTGAGSRSATNVSTIAWSHVVGSGSNRYMVVAVAASHLGGQWDYPSNYGTKTVTSSLDGAFTYLGGVPAGVNNQWVGGIMLFGLANPTIGSHTITANIITQGNNQALQGNSVAYTGVGTAPAANSAATHVPNAQGAFALTVPSTAGGMSVCAGIFDGNTPNPASLNQTGRHLSGASLTGTADFLAIADAGGTNTAGKAFTTTSTGDYRAGLGINLPKAA